MPLSRLSLNARARPVRGRMFLGLFIHVPPAVITWHLVYKYWVLMLIQTAKIERRAAVPATAGRELY